MDFREVDNLHAHSIEAGSNYGRYYCTICNKDTLHRVNNVLFDNYDIECSSCGTTSVTRADFFDSYEEEVVNLEQELDGFDNIF